MNKAERVRKVLKGKNADRTPISFWHHFKAGQWCGKSAVDAHLRHLDTYNLDFLKVMNDNGYPREGKPYFSDIKDLKLLREYHGDEGPFAKQLEVLHKLSTTFRGEVMMTSTVFSPWSVLRNLTVDEPEKHGPPVLEIQDTPQESTIRQWLKEDEGAVASALLIIARNLRNFAKYCIEAGANGIFFSVRDDWVAHVGSKETYNKIVRPADRIIFEGISSVPFNMLHICGKALDFEAFASYPFQLINWADHSAGPSIKDIVSSLRPAICGGVDNLKTLVEGSPKDCETEVHDALAQAGTRPIFISPGCTYDPLKVPKENLLAICKAVGAL